MDNLTKAQRQKNMRNIKSHNTSPEMIVRRILHKAGFRYRLHRKDLPGKPDIVFAGRRRTIFIHGCFWHQHPGCRRCTQPASNPEYWTPKLQRNVTRDAANLTVLHEASWKTLVVWECETRDADRLRQTLTNFLHETTP